MLDHRRHLRVSYTGLGAMRTGKILFNEGCSKVNCTIHDISVGGACLHVFDTTTVPRKFEFLTDAGKVKRFCTVVWRTDKRLGVSFQP
jgi:hypothetical protein